MGEFAEYPKMVYGPLGEQKVVESAEDIPEGYMTLDEYQARPDPAQQAQEARNAARQALDEERAKLRAFLDEHRVDYPKNLGIARLRELAGQLEEHLKAQGVFGGDGA